jgi:hypothetical protein
MNFSFSMKPNKRAGRTYILFSSFYKIKLHICLGFVVWDFGVLRFGVWGFGFWV